MAKSTLAVQSQSSEKEICDGKNNPDEGTNPFWFPVYEGLFGHAPVIRDAVWLFMWLIARTTRESNGSGSVLGGVPIHDGRPAGELGFPPKTIRRWRRTLVTGGYIATLRTPYGFRYTLLKSKKWQKLEPREFPKLPISQEENSRNGHREFPLRAQRIPETGISKKTIQRQHKEEAEEEAEEEAAAPAVSPKEKPKTKPKNHPAWKVIDLKRCGTPRFCKEWEGAYDDAGVGESIVDLMETAIQSCQENGIVVPAPFYKAKRALEAESDDDAMSKIPGAQTCNHPYAFPTHDVPD